jgi:hypothetical protein
MSRSGLLITDAVLRSAAMSQLTSGAPSGEQPAAGQPVVPAARAPEIPSDEAVATAADGGPAASALVVEGAQIEYKILRDQIAEADRTCVVLLGALITATLTLINVALSQGNPDIAWLVAPLWVVGHMYLVEKRSVILHTAHYLRVELERPEWGLRWETWHHQQINRPVVQPARYYPFFLECVVAAVAVFATPALVWHVSKHGLATFAFLASVVVAVGFAGVLARSVVRYLAFERYLAELT